ncbi:MAG: hypothetical protein LBS62_15015 [Clostridiales bacterium]|jgi:nitrogenase molybdenum-iron protein alpha/beta subunit|nr:hypothetical protein [Clostridiales bacterium]
MIRPADREKRLGLITAYYGAPEALLGEYAAGNARQRMRTFTQSAEDEISRAVEELRRIPCRGELCSPADDSAIIIHGPRGCAMAGGDSGTKLTEKDSIMGSEKKLRAEIHRVYNASRPKRIFVVTTPVVAINNDDVLTVCAELTGSLGIDILPVVTTGFKNKSPENGIDYARRALGLDAAAEIREPEASAREGLLAGRRVYIALPPGRAAAYIRAVSSGSGGNIAGVTLGYADKTEATEEVLRLLAGLGLPVHVANNQDYELTNLLKSAVPDLFVGETDNVLTAARLGIACVNVSVTPPEAFADAAETALGYSGFARRLAEAPGMPARYSLRALLRPGGWYIKPEAKL